MGSKAADSDIRMMIAAQVAYLDAPADGSLCVGDLIEQTIRNCEGRSDLSEKQQKQLKAAQSLKTMIEKHRLRDCNRWVVVDAGDRNRESGFYGCLIDTRDGDAIVGFRGSECYDEQWVKDWAEADAGLLNSTATRQQRDAEEFVRHINDKYGNTYNSFNFSGHSLGGNLAEHATVTAPEGMMIGRTVSFDGPGFSDEYIIAHSGEIARNSKYIDHYQYSPVAALLFPLPGTNYQTIDACDSGGVFGFGRHSLSNIVFDQDGNVQAGTRDIYSTIIGPLSKELEWNHPLMLICPQFGMLVWMAEHGNAILLGMKNEAEHLWENAESFLQSLKEAAENWYRSLSGVALTGEFELNEGYVTALGSGMDDVAKKLAAVSGEISDIAGALRYHSIAGSYYKSKLRILSGRVSRDSGKSSALGEAVRECVRYCKNSDSQVAGLFEEL